MATVLKPVRLVNPGRAKRLTWAQKLHFGTKRQRSAAAARLHGKRSNPSNRKVNKVLKKWHLNRKAYKSSLSGNQAKTRYYNKRSSERRANVGEIITVRPLAHIMNRGKQRRTHQIRRLYPTYWTKYKRGKPKGYKVKTKRRKNTGIMAKSRKRVLAGKKAARTRARRRSYGASRRRTSNPGHRRRRTYRRRTTMALAPRRRRTHRHNPGMRRRHYRNPGIMSGGTGIFTQALGVIGGALVTKFGTDAVTSMSPTLATGIPSYIVTAIVATLQGKAIGKILKNPRLGNDMTIGGYVYLALRLMQDFLPAIGNPFSLSGIRGMGLVGPSSFWTPQVNQMNTMGSFVNPMQLTNAIAAGMPVASGMRGLGTSNTQRRTGRMR